MKSRAFSILLAAALLAAVGATPATAQTRRVVVQNGPTVFPGVGTCASTAAAMLGLTGGWGRGDAGTGSTTFVDAGTAPYITPPPMGAGALREAIPGPAGAGDIARIALVNPGAAGQLISSFTGILSAVKYSHNVGAAVALGPAPGFWLFVDLSLGGVVGGPGSGIDEILFYNPGAQGVPCLAAHGSWIECSVLGGTFTKATGGPATSLGAYLTANPTAKFPPVPSPAFAIVSGGAPAFSLFDAAADLVILDAVAPVLIANPPTSEIEFDFEKDCSAYGGDGDFDCQCDQAPPGVSVLNIDQCPGDPSPTPADTDADGTCDAADNCPAIANAGQEDADGDGTGDVCDSCTDTDGDGLGDPGFGPNVCANDNCPDVANVGQEDTDGDGAGDACDLAGLSLRRAVVVNNNKPNTDIWSAQGQLDASLTPTFVAGIDGGGVTVTVETADGTLVDSVAFSGAECSEKKGSIKCTGASKQGFVRFARGFAPLFFKVVLSLRNQSLSLPVLADAPLRVTIVGPGGEERADSVNTCTATPASGPRRMVCKQVP